MTLRAMIVDPEGKSLIDAIELECLPREGEISIIKTRDGKAASYKIQAVSHRLRDPKPANGGLPHLVVVHVEAVAPPEKCFGKDCRQKPTTQYLEDDPHRLFGKWLCAHHFEQVQERLDGSR